MKFEGNFGPLPDKETIDDALAGIELETKREEEEIEKSGSSPDEFEYKNGKRIVMSESEKKKESKKGFDYRKMLSSIFRNPPTITELVSELDNTTIVDDSGFEMNKESILSILMNLKMNLKNSIVRGYYKKKEIPIFDKIKDVTEIHIESKSDKKITFTIYFNKTYLFSKTLEILKFEVDNELNITIPHNPI